MVAGGASNTIVRSIVIFVIHYYITTGTPLNIDLKSGATHYEKFGPNPRVIIDILLDLKMEA